MPLDHYQLGGALSHLVCADATLEVIILNYFEFHYLVCYKSIDNDTDNGLPIRALLLSLLLLSLSCAVFRESFLISIPTK